MTLTFGKYSKIDDILILTLLYFTPALNGVRPFFEIGVIRAGVDGVGV